jgi:hypothetical protein
MAEATLRSAFYSGNEASGDYVLGSDSSAKMTGTEPLTVSTETIRRRTSIFSQQR